MSLPETRPTGTASPAESVLADRFLLLLLAAGAFVIVLAGTTSATFELDRFSVPKELALNATALLAAPVLMARWRHLRLTAIDVLLGGFVGWSALSAAFAANRWLSLRALAITVSGSLVFLAARRMRGTAGPMGSEEDGGGLRDVALRAIALAAVAGALTGVLQAYGVSLPVLAQERAPGGTFGNRNFLAHLTAIAIPIVALLAVRARSRASWLSWLIALAICGNAIVLTRSRAGWLGLVAAAVVGLLASLVVMRAAGGRIRFRRRPVFSLAALCMGAAAAMLLPNTLQWTSDSPYAETLGRLTEYRAGSGRGRLIQYANSLELVPRNPLLGTGPGNWFIEYPLVTTPGDPAWAGAEPIPTNPWPSSDWVALVVERGPVGLLLGLLLGVAMGLAALLRLGGPDRQAAGDAVALLSVLAATAVTGLFDAVLLNPAPAFFVAAAIGLLLPASHPVLDRPLPKRARAALAAAVLGITLAGTTRSAQQLAAIRIVENGGASADAMRRALRIDPPNHRLHLRLASRGSCESRRPHALAAVRLMPYHEAPARALAACR